MKYTLSNVIIYITIVIILLGAILVYLSTSFFRAKITERVIDEKITSLQSVKNILTQPFWRYREALSIPGGASRVFITEEAKTPGVLFLRIIDTQNKKILFSSLLYEEFQVLNEVPEVIGEILVRDGVFHNKEIKEIIIKGEGGQSLWMGVSADSINQIVSKLIRREAINISSIIFIMLGLVIFVYQWGSKDVKKYQQELIRFNAELEKKVELRTRELREEQSRLIASIKSLPVGILIADLQSNIIVRNQKLADIFGLTNHYYKIDEIIEKFPKEINITDYYQKCISEKKFIELREVSINEKIVRIFLAPIIIDNDLKEIIGQIFLVEDITEAKIIERSKDEFFSIASHELRTPLTVILGNITILRDFYTQQFKDNKDIIDIITDMEESGKRLIMIVNDFLDVARLEQKKLSFKKEKLDLDDLIKSTIGQHEATFRKKGLFLEFQKEKETTPNIILGDKDKIKQILFNLINNSFNFTQKGGVTIEVKKEVNFIEVFIKDTGSGISPENQKLLFREFQQAGKSILARDISTGTGLGLYISKLLVNGMGGNISLKESQIDKGSIFSFTLPKA